MATQEIIGARTYTADRRAIAVLREMKPEAAEAISMTTGVDTEGHPAPVSFHVQEHAAFVSESLAAALELVAAQAEKIEELEGRLDAVEGA
jgi:hypothetical protein